MDSPRPLALLFRALAALALSLAANAQDIVRMRDVVRHCVDDKTFMGAVLVARDGEMLLNEGFGFANIEWQIPNTPTTKFRLGSITKQFTAAAILLLAERGKLSLDDPIRKHWPDAPGAWDSVTIYHVLTHTAGISNLTSFPEFATFRVSPSPVEKTIALFKDRPLEFVPGSQMRYSNSGYVLLGYLIERISGQSYAAFLRENIFEPLGMQDTGYDEHAAIIERRAAGYSPSPNGFVNSPYVDMTIPGGAGGLYSTTEDLLRWTQGLFAGTLLTGASLEKMTTPFRDNYALGVNVTERNGRKAIGHNGGIEGFNTSLAYYPAEKLTIVVLGNLNGGAPTQIASQVAAVMFGEPIALPSARTEVQLPPEVLDDYAGAYPLAPNFILTVTVVNGGLISRATGQVEVPFYAEAKDKFFARALDAQIEFVRSDDGNVNGLILQQGQTKMRASRQ
ncbi:MAG TPA: serine hydrolase [Gammaproteobacteria bacterium]